MPVPCKTPEEILEELFSKATRVGTCLVSHLKPNAKGYVYVCLGGRKGKRVRANRFVFEQVNDEELLPSEMVLHDCDTRNCIEPKHLIKGSAQDNMDDMVEKGRNRNQHSAKVLGHV